MASAEPIDDMQLTHEESNEEYPFDGIHGVLHLLSINDMQQLDDFEGT